LRSAAARATESFALRLAFPEASGDPAYGVELTFAQSHIADRQRWRAKVSETLERHEFGAEVGRLLDLVVHALYSDREIFLRELVANAADATDRRRFEALTQPDLTPPADAKVRIVPDMAARTLTISDAGIGMS
jgi:hypothetical protein